MVVGVEPGHHRRRRGRRPRRGARRLIEADAARRQAVDRPRVEESRAVTAEMVGAERIRDVDEDVHSGADCRDGASQSRSTSLRAREADTALRDLRGRRDLAYGERGGAAGDPMVRPDDDRERDPHGARSLLQLRAARPRGVLRRCDRGPPRIPHDERRRRPGERWSRRGDPPPPLDRRHRALAALRARVPGGAPGRAGGDRTGGDPARPRRARRRADGARERYPQRHPATRGAPGRPHRRAHGGHARRHERSLARLGELPRLGRARRLPRSPARARGRGEGACPLPLGARGGHALHLERADAARGRPHGAVHEPARRALPGRHGGLRGGDIRERRGPRAHVRRLRRRRAAGRARLQRDRPPAAAPEARSCAASP